MTDSEPGENLSPLREQITKLHTDIVADKLRQQAGVNLRDKKGKGKGTDVRPAVNALEGRTDEAGVELRERLRLWIAPDDPQEDLAKTEVTQEGLLSLGDLAEMRGKVSDSVKVWFEEKDPDVRMKKMADYQSELDRQARESLLKMEIIRRVSGNDAALKPTFDQFAQFIHEDLHISDSEGVVIKAKKSESYEDKAKRLWQNERARKKIIELVKPTDESLARFAVEIETDMLRIATQVNHLRLVEAADEWIRDNSQKLKLGASSLAEVKDKVDAVMAVDEGTDRGRKKAEEVLMAIAPVIRFIRQEFPHDHAYLLSHCLEKKQAVCAGKEMMLGMLLKDMGLDPKYTATIVRNDNSLDKHVVTHLRIAEHLAEIDLNFVPKNDWQEDNFGCLVNILEASAEYTDKFPPFADLKNFDVSQWVVEDGRWRKFDLVKGTGPHKVCVEGRLGDIEGYNLALLLLKKESLDTTVGDDTEKRKAIYLEAEELYRQAIVLNPNEPDIKNNLANLLWKKEYLDLSVGNNPEQRRSRYQEAEELYREAMNLDPDYCTARNNLDKLLRNEEYRKLVGEKRFNKIKNAIKYARIFRHFRKYH